MSADKPSADYDAADIALALRILTPGDDDNVTLGELRRGVPHDHAEYVEGCFRCDLSRDEATVTAPAESQKADDMADETTSDRAE